MKFLERDDGLMYYTPRYYNIPDSSWQSPPEDPCTLERFWLKLDIDTVIPVPEAEDEEIDVYNLRLKGGDLVKSSDLYLDNAANIDNVEDWDLLIIDLEGLQEEFYTYMEKLPRGKTYHLEGPVYIVGEYWVHRDFPYDPVCRDDVDWESIEVDFDELKVTDESKDEDVQTD